MDMNDEMVKERFMSEAKDGRISCSKCIEIADELNIEKGQIASALTSMHIKIIQCQLGCFE